MSGPKAGDYCELCKADYSKARRWGVECPDCNPKGTKRSELPDMREVLAHHG